MTKHSVGRWPVCALGTASVFVGHSSAVLAAESTGDDPQLEEVVVTAERRAVDLQKTALSVSTLSAAQVEKTGISNYPNLLETIPGVQVQVPPGPTTTPYIAIRGLGTDGDNKPGAVAIYSDGVMIGAWGGQLYDLDRVEILRGPQGTLYGGVATGGALNIITRKPSLDGYSGSAQLEVGNYGLVHTIATFNAPLGDQVALRMAVNNQQRNQYANDSVSGLNFTNARAQLLVQSSEDLTVIFGGEFYRGSGVNGDGYAAQTPSGQRAGAYDPELGYSSDRGLKGTVEVNWKTAIGEVTSISAYQAFKGDESSIQGTNAFDYHYDKRDTASEELRVASEIGTRLNSVLGVYYSEYRLDTSTLAGLSSPILPVGTTVACPFPAFLCATPVGPSTTMIVPETRDNKSLGLFGQLTFKLTDSTRVTGGLRYSRDDVKDNQVWTWNSFLSGSPDCTRTGPISCSIPTDFKQIFSNVDWLARIEQDLTGSSLVYALASTGYRPGGAGAPRTALSLPQTVYGKETVKSYEIGTKNRFVHDRLQVNGAIYYNDYPAFQNLLNYNNGGGVAAAVVGVPARIYGTELELKAVVTADDLIDASASYINARYTADAIATNPFTGAPDPLSTKGQALPHAPKLQFNLDYNHSFWFTNDSKVVWDVTAHYQDKQAVAFSNCLYSGSDSSIACQTAVPATDPATIAKYVQRSYTLFDSSISFSSKGDRFTATLYGRNLTDRVIKTSVLESTVLATYAPPRTVGLVLTGRF